MLSFSLQTQLLSVIRNTTRKNTLYLRPLSPITKLYHFLSPSLSSPLLVYPNNEQFRSLFLQTQDTPNPESLKILPGRPVLSTINPDKLYMNKKHDINSLPHVGFYVKREDKHEIIRSPLATELFLSVEGIKAIFLGSDFITITKYAEAKWDHVRVETFSVIMEFYSSGKPALLDKPLITDTTILNDDNEIVAMIKELLETKIRPSVMEDGGNIEYVRFDEQTGMVYVKLAGSCVGCPSASITLKNGVENMMKHYIPEVMGVTTIEEEEKNGDNIINN